MTFHPTSCRLLKLMVVESPSKARTVLSLVTSFKDLSFDRPELASLHQEKGERVEVCATLGHMTEMDALWITPTSDKLLKFEPKWTVTPKRRTVLDRIFNLIASSGRELSEIIYATDPDREGELIAALLHQQLVNKFRKLVVSRAYIHSMTPEGIEIGLKTRTLGGIDRPLAEAAETRHILDRLVGFIGSRVFQVLSSRELRSIGRVQTPALRIALDRQREHQALVDARKAGKGGEVGWTGQWEMQSNGNTTTTSAEATHSTVTLRTVKNNGISQTPWKPKTLKEAQAIAQQFFKDDRQVSESHLTETSESRLTSANSLLLRTQQEEDSPSSSRSTMRSIRPPAPLTLQTLMLLLGKRARLSSSAVADAAQQLFTEGLITYPRTDSTRISSEAVKHIQAYIVASFGADALGSIPMESKAVTEAKASDKSSRSSHKSKIKINVEDAHEALRPTSMSKTPASLKTRLSPTLLTVYNAIHSGTTAAFMKPQRLQSVRRCFVSETTNVSQPNGEELAVVVNVSASRVVEPGWIRAITGNNQNFASDESDEPELVEPPKNRYEQLTDKSIVLSLTSLTPVERFPAPPPLMFEGLLIQSLKKRGIGRPSTYASIMATLQKRQYVRISPGGRITVLSSGERLADAATKHLGEFVGAEFTAEMESELEKVARGSVKGDQVASKLLVELLAAIHKAIRVVWIEQATAESHSNNGDGPDLSRIEAAVDRQVPPLSQLGSIGARVELSSYTQAVGHHVYRYWFQHGRYKV